MRIAAIFYLFILIVTVLKLNPGLYDFPWRQNRLSPLRQPIQTLPFQFENLTSRTAHPALSVYREDPARSGVNRNSLLNGSLRKVWNSVPFNAGIHDASKASPAVDSSGIYLGADTGWFYALEFDGRIRWKYKVALTNQGIHGTAATDRDNVYFGAYNGYLYSLNKSNGGLNWSVRLGSAIGSSPALMDGALFVSVETNRMKNGMIAKVDASNGKILWMSAWLGGHPHSSPALDADGQRLFVGSNNGALTAIESGTGRTIWMHRTGGAIKSTPTVLGETIFVTSWDHSLRAIAKETGHLLWKLALGDASQSSPSVVPGLNRVVVANSMGTIFGIDTVKRSVAWKIDNDHRILSSPLIVRVNKREDSYHVVIGCGRKTLCVVEPNRGKVIARRELTGDLSSVPVANGDKLFLAEDYPGGLSIWR